MKFKIILLVIISLMFIAALIVKSDLILNAAVETAESNNVQISEDPFSNEFTGEYVCLPHTDTSGPQTLECAFGLKLEDGTHVALDFNQIPPEVSQSLTTGSILTLYGELVPVEQLSSNHWQKYPITGIVQVADIKL